MIAWALSWAILSNVYFLSNWLDVLKQERLEDPVETALDVLNRNLTITVYQADQMKTILSSGPFPELAKRLGMACSVIQYSQTS